MFDGRREFERDGEELCAVATSVLRSGAYILGPEVGALEEEAAAYLGARHAVGVASGTDAIALALRAAGVQPGDTVVTSSFTFFATVSAVLAVGATPALADVDPDTLCVDPASVEALLDRLSSEGRCVGAVVVVHLYGQTPDMEEVAEVTTAAGVPLLEDAAQAFGARWDDRHAGTLGVAGCFSFFPTKNLGAFGDAGLVTTDDDALADRLRLLRAHGSRVKYVHEQVGTNSRLDALQAALLRVRLRGIDEALAARRAHAARYDAAFAGVDGVEPVRTGARRVHTYHQYVVRVGSDRDELRRRLRERGVETAVHYPVPVHMQPALAHLGYCGDDLPVAAEAAERVLSLPMFPSLSDEEVDYVAGQVAASL